MTKYPFYLQLDSHDCGPTCLRMICKFYGKSFSEYYMHKICFTKRTGTSLLGIKDAAEDLGFEVIGAKVDINKLVSINAFPCIVQWSKKHFVVVYGIDDNFVKVGDPSSGILKYSIEKFCQCWLSLQGGNDDHQGIVLFLEPTQKFYAINDVEMNQQVNKMRLSDLIPFLSPHKSFLVGLFLSVAMTSLINLIFPFLTQSIVDIGIGNKSLKFIIIVFICELSLSLGGTINSYLSNWFVLHISSRLNISLVSAFLIKLMRLPISFFTRRMVGDLLQRLSDFSRIEQFLTNTVISIIMAMLGFIVYGYVLLRYGTAFLMIFLAGAILYVTWVLLFLQKRKKIDYMRFQGSSENQTNIIHMIAGMQDIKLNNCEGIQLKKWQKIQYKLYNINIQGLSLAQAQSIGGSLINELKNIIISFMAAYYVISGNITLGMMMAIQYLVGQLNGPLFQIIGFIQSLQDTKISAERINEINMNDDEDSLNAGKISHIAVGQDIKVRHVDFHYNGPRSPKVLDDINLTIKGGKVTAIVGESGSGKTTLMKLLLGFFEPTQGEIYVGATSLNDIDKRSWKKCCSAVLQDGYIFTDSIKNNIGLIDEHPNDKMVRESAHKACIDEFIDSLPLKYETIIGTDGNSVSMGQKQRILIARAIYKNSRYLFLDEATNSLDANNEQRIIKNLDNFYKGKTVVVIAHRISTVVNADNIVVMRKGKIVEQGTNVSLLERKGYYYDLVKNQLNIG